MISVNKPFQDLNNDLKVSHLIDKGRKQILFEEILRWVWKKINNLKLN